MTMARRLVLIVVGAALLTIFVSRFVLIGLLTQRIAFELALAVVEAIAIFGIGALAKRALTALLSSKSGSTFAEGSAVSELPTAFILGYPIFGALCFLTGTIRISAVTMLVPLILGAAAAVIRVRLAPHPAFGHPLPSEEGFESLDVPENHDLQHPLTAGEGARSAAEGRETAFAFFSIAIVLACGFINAQAPPVSLDEVAYHLAIPHAWTVEGRAIELPLLSHSYFPLGIESADLPFFAILGSSGGTASHFLHLFAAAAVAMILWRRSKRMGNAVLVAAAIVATPALAVTTGWSLVEWPLVGIFLVAALAAEDGDDATLAAAIAAGLLTKYTFVPFAIVLAIVTRRWKPALIGAVVGSVFFVRNVVLTGNPVAPFLSAHSPHVSGFRVANLAAYIFDGRFVDEALGGSILMLVPATAGLLAWISVAIAALLFVAAASSRILLPYLAVGAFSTARKLNADGVTDRRVALTRQLFDVLLVGAIASQILLVIWFTWRDDAFSLIAGRTSDDQYVATRRASYPAIAWLNSVLPADSRTLAIGLNETYWFEHPVRGGGNFDGPRMSAYLDDPQLETKLRRDGITHVALFPAEPTTAEPRKRQERDTTLAPGAQKALTQLLQKSVVAAGPGGVRLLKVR